MCELIDCGKRKAERGKREEEKKREEPVGCQATEVCRAAAGRGNFLFTLSDAIRRSTETITLVSYSEPRWHVVIGQCYNSLPHSAHVQALKSRNLGI